MSKEVEAMWAKKLGLISHDAILVNELLKLMVLSKVDYTIFSESCLKFQTNYAQ